MVDSVEYFGIEANKKIIERFIGKLENISTKSEFEKVRNDYIKMILENIIRSPLNWDKSCQININWIGDNFILTLASDVQGWTSEYLDKVFSSCFRFLYELHISVSEELPIELLGLMDFIKVNSMSFSKGSQEQIQFALQDMPARIVKNIINNPSIKNAKDLSLIESRVKQIQTEFESSLNEREKRVNDLKEVLEKYENAFNFVGLYEGFDRLSNEKKEEKGNIFKWLIVLGIVAVLPVISEIIYIYLGDADKIKDFLLIATLPTLSLVALIIYYFRVLLFNYKSVSSQLLQIELRKTLCRFIQSYSDYSFKLKDKNNNSLERFENIIFSSIVSDESDLPSTYDGLEQIKKLIMSVKS